MKIFSVAIPLILAGCASAQKSFDPRYTEEYRARDNLGTSLLGKNGLIGEEEILKLLSRKVSFPGRVNLAIVRLGDPGIPPLPGEEEGVFYQRESWGERVASLTPLPGLLLPKEPSLANLRQAAALVQADALLIVKPVSRADWRFRFLAADQAKAVTSLEVALLDVRSSAVPYSALVSEEAEVRESAEDFSKTELMERARLKSEAKALGKIPSLLKRYLEQVL